MHDRPMTVLIADDEPVARRRLVRLIQADADLTLVAECAGGNAAVDQIRALSPDIAILDIQMPDLDGLQVAAEIGAENMPAVVFATAYDKYALNAFDVHAVDYLLKPYDEMRFLTALTRLKQRVVAKARAPQAPDAALQALIAQVVADLRSAGDEPFGRYHERVAVKVDGSIRVIPIADVDWFETDGNYIRVHAGRGNYLIRNTATRLMEELDPRRFARIHRRYLVNLERVVEVEPWFGGDAVVRLRDGTKLRLSRNYRDAFHARMLSDHSEAGARRVGGDTE